MIIVPKRHPLSLYLSLTLSYVFCLVYFALPFTSGHNNGPLVQTNKGLVRGIVQQTVTGKSAEVFLGVPYAKPPIGRYRFRHPQPIDPWRGELDASKFANSCYQVNDTFFGASFRGTSMWNANTPLDEDCLHLNIWAPMGSSIKYTYRPSNIGNNDDNLSASSLISSSSSLASSAAAYSDDTGGYASADSGDSGYSGGYRRGTSSRYAPPESKRLRPVLVWIFGGGFYYGTSSLSIYDGGILATEEDILVVSMNYRVAAFGFLYFGRPDAPGNSGLFDQLMALQWLNDNVEQFGGDPQRITIFGESAGAVSVAFHLLSPLSRNLFSQAILQSGAATCPWGIKDTKEMIVLGLELAKALQCPATMNDLDAVIECLIQADPMALVTQDVGHYKNVVDFPFVPVVDGSFLLEQPDESLAKSNFKKTRLLLGSNSDEGNFFLIYRVPEFNKCPPPPPSPPTSPVFASPSSSSASSHAGPLGLASNLNSKQLSFAGKLNNNNNNNNYHSRDQDDADINEDQYTSASKQRPLSYDMAILASQPSASSASPSSSSMPMLSSSSASSSASSSNQAQSSVSDGATCRPPDRLNMEREDFLRLVKDDLNPFAYQNIGKEAIIYEYTNWNNPNDSISNYDAMDKIVGDYFFTCHVNEFAHRYAMTDNSVYMYYFKHRSTVSPWPEWMGVLHADEINFIFGEPLNPIYGYSPQEVQLSRRMMNYWANFAKYGNPTRINETNLLSEQWPQYSNNREYLELRVGSSTRIGHGPRAKKCAFWQHYLPKLLNTSSQAQSDECRSSLNGMGKSRFFSGGSKQPIVFALTGIIVIILILLLLLLAKRTWKPDLNVAPDRRRRNQRQMNINQNQQQQQQQQASTATGGGIPNANNNNSNNTNMNSTSNNALYQQQQQQQLQQQQQQQHQQHQHQQLHSIVSHQQSMPLHNMQSAMHHHHQQQPSTTGNKLIKSHTITAPPSEATLSAGGKNFTNRAIIRKAANNLLAIRTKNDRVINTLTSKTTHHQMA